MYVTIPIFFIWLLWLFWDAFVHVYNTFLPEDKWADMLKKELCNKGFVFFLSITGIDDRKWYIYISVLHDG
jgi:hypothetical protein